jgi:cob(I)alamin adenosyltransferase
MSIATQRGDGGETSLIGGEQVSKGGLRIEAIGVVDELGAQLAFLRAICPNTDIKDIITDAQRRLFAIGESLATGREGNHQRPLLNPVIVDALTNHVHRLESIDGLLIDWALPGDVVTAAACEVARTVCRRAERALVRLRDAEEPVDPLALAYLNRLADVLWLSGRLLEREANVDTRLRQTSGGNSPWSRAW